MKIASAAKPARPCSHAGDDDQERERRDHEHDVREHVQELVDDPAAVAGGEADERPEQPGEPAAEDADDEARAHAVDELRVDVLARRGRPEPVLRRRRVVGEARRTRAA